MSSELAGGFSDAKAVRSDIAQEPDPIEQKQDEQVPGVCRIFGNTNYNEKCRIEGAMPRGS